MLRPSQNLQKKGKKKIASKRGRVGFFFFLDNVDSGVGSSSEGILELSEDLMLVGEGEGVDGVKDSLDISVGRTDESGIVDIDEESNEELAVHAISDTSVAGDELVKVLLLEGALHGRGEESTEGGDDGSKETNDDSVELDGHEVQVANESGKRELEGQNLRHGLRREERTNGTSSRRGSELSSRATEPINITEEASREEGDDDGDRSGTNKALPGLVGRQGGQRTVDKLASNRHTNEVGHNIVTDDQGVGQHEPEETVVNVHRNHTRLDDNAQKGHQHPGQLTELVLDSILTKRDDEEQETNDVQDE